MVDEEGDVEKTMDTILGEEWFPVGEVSVESLRERQAMTALPPTYYIHVWFARRPLIASRAAIVASLVDPKFLKDSFFNLMGFHTSINMYSVFKEYQRKKAAKETIKGNPFAWKRAFTHNPSPEETNQLLENISPIFGLKLPVILDPMAGGGSIPLESIRLGLPTVANDLNPVAYICLKGSVEYPAKFGKDLISPVKAFCEKINEKAQADLISLFPKSENEEIYAYLWTRTIKCTKCGLIIPLSPNWWVLQDTKNGIGAQPCWDEKNDICTFSLIHKPDLSKFNPEKGTTTGGDADCPRCKSRIDSEIIKKMAQAGELGHQLYCVCTKVSRHKGKGKDWIFRDPTKFELELSDQVQLEITRLCEFIPSESIPVGLKTREPLNMGMDHWRDLFNPRQLLTHATYMKHFLDAKKVLFTDIKPGTQEWEFATAICLYGAMVFDSCLNYNSVQGRWHSKRLLIAGAMDMQAFPFRWSYAEFDHSRMLWPWAQKKTEKALKELIDLIPKPSGSISILNTTAQALPLDSASVDAIIVDPPYGNNVMYAEISDFFYVWLKRLVGDLYPASFRNVLTNKEDEAVANSVRFAGAKRGQAKLQADQDYAAKMEACFLEMHRVLKDGGVLCVMFTHRESAAWEGLAESLMNAGFTFKSSWPVHTEPGEKFGKANKGALKVTVILYCRKRKEHQPGRWEDVIDEIRETAQLKVKEYQNFGITGPDLLVSLYGPAMGKFSEYYPVKDITGRVRNIKDAFTIVAEVVNEHLTGDIDGADMETLAYLNLLRNASGLIMEVDLARICTVFGGNTSLDMLDIKGGTGLVKKVGSKVIILTAKKRLEEGIFNPDRPNSFRGLMDVVHASLIIYEREGITSVTRLLQEAGRDARDAGIISVLSAIGSLGEETSGDLGAEARIANALLEALGHSPAGIGKTGEKITHWS